MGSWVDMDKEFLCQLCRVGACLGQKGLTGCGESFIQIYIQTYCRQTGGAEQGIG